MHLDSSQTDPHAAHESIVGQDAAEVEQFAAEALFKRQCPYFF
jgi:hypothetical protein